jgi:hypothetical protein
MSYEKDALYAEVEIPSAWTIANIGDFTGFLSDVPEVHWRVRLSKGTIEIAVDFGSDYYHGRSPHATHEFCKGWVVRGVIERIEEMLHGRGTVDWQKISWIPDRWQIVKSEPNGAPRELKKVPLHEPA